MSIVKRKLRCLAGRSFGPAFHSGRCQLQHSRPFFPAPNQVYLLCDMIESFWGVCWSKQVPAAWSYYTIYIYNIYIYIIYYILYNVISYYIYNIIYIYIYDMRISNRIKPYMTWHHMSDKPVLLAAMPLDWFLHELELLQILPRKCFWSIAGNKDQHLTPVTSGCDTL